MVWMWKGEKTLEPLGFQGKGKITAHNEIWEAIINN